MADETPSPARSRSETEPKLDVDTLVSGAVATFAALADPDKAKPMTTYLKDQFEFFGVQAGPRRQAQRGVVKELADASPEQLLAFADACWQRPQRELHYLACDSLRKYSARLTADHLPAVETLITTNSWWDTVDSLAAYVVGAIVGSDRSQVAVMDVWINDPNLWRARTAILHQLSYKESTDAERLFHYCRQRADDTEFFIRKALGWALRQYARVAPDEVRAFVTTHDKELSGLTKREAMRWIKVAP